MQMIPFPLSRYSYRLTRVLLRDFLFFHGTKSRTQPVFEYLILFKEYSEPTPIHALTEHPRVLERTLMWARISSTWAALRTKEAATKSMSKPMPYLE